MKILEIAFFGYSVTDIKKARAFYEGALGLKPTHIFGDDTQAWIEYDIASCTIAINNGTPGWKPCQGGGSASLEVEDFAAAVSELKAKGVKFYVEPLETPVCHIAVVADPDGNSIGIHKRKAR
jgi:predicted enzyme related to lactoylglutathione lyase